MTTKRDRGEYRPIYEVMLDGPDWQRLPADARFILIALKLKCGALGIKVVPGLVESLTQWTGLSVRRVQTATKVLTNSHWIEREGPVVWVVRGLEFEPTMDPSNTNHRKYFARTLEALPSLPIVARMRARYSEWHSEGIPHPLGDGMGDALPITSPSTSPSPNNLPPTRAREDDDPFFSDPRVIAFLGAVPVEKHGAWAAILSQWRAGEGWGAGAKPTDAQIADGLAAAVTAKDGGPMGQAFVAGCVRRSMQPVRAVDPESGRPLTYLDKVARGLVA